jgi:O-antigen/teichoic acid export membrane protein
LRVGYNLFSSLLKNSFVLLLGFFSTPLLLKYLGSELMGNFRLIGDWLSFVSIIELSISTIFLAELRKLLHHTDDTVIHKNLINESLISYGKGLLWIWLICLVLYFPFINSSKVSDLLIFDTTTGYILVSLAFVFLPLTPMRLYLEVIERSDLVNYLVSIENLVVISLSLFFAYLRFGVTGQAAAFFLGCTLSYFLIWWFFKVKFPSYKFEWRGEKNLNWKKALKAKVRDSLALNIFHSLSLNSSNIIVAIFFSAKEVIPFFLTQRLSQIAFDQTANIGNAAWASVVSKIKDTNEVEAKEIFKQRFYEVTKVICLSCAAFSVPIIIWNGDFMSLWIGEAYYAGPAITILACFLSLSNSLISFWKQILNAYGKISEQLWPTFIQAIVSIGLSVTFTSYFGLLGPLLGIASTFMIYQCWQFLYLLKKHLDLSIFSLSLRIFPTIFFTACFAFLTYKIKHFFLLPISWTNMSLQVGLSFILFIASSYLILLTKSERKIWSQRFLRLKSIF